MTNTRVLITGATGFVGSHLVDYLSSLTALDIYGTRRRRSDMSNLVTPIVCLDCEITDPASVASAVQLAKPDLVFHLAAQSYVPESHTAPHHTFTTNVLGTLNLLVALLRHAPEARLLLAGTSEEYGHCFPTDFPLKEYQPLHPLSPYGVSKVAMELLGCQFHASYGLHVVTTRAFNHTGPRRGEQFVTSSFAKQVAEIEAGIRQPIIYVGNLDAKRDWTDVRDVVRAYWLAIHDCLPAKPYNICSGKAHRIRDILHILQQQTDNDFTTHADASRIRPSDIPLLLGDHTMFTAKTGWRPTIPFHQTMKDLLDYWRERVQH